MLNRTLRDASWSLGGLNMNNWSRETEKTWIKIIVIACIVYIREINQSGVLVSAAANSLQLLTFLNSFLNTHTISHHSVTRISADWPSSGPSVSVNGNQQGNDDWAATAAYRLVADGHGLWQLSSAMATLPGPSLGIISAQHISLSSASHTDLLIISICGERLLWSPDC